MAKRAPAEVKIDTNRWLTTYADLMNNLLVMFIMLYAISVIDLSKYEKLVVSFSNTFGKTTKTVEVTGTGDFSIEDITKEKIDLLLSSPSPLPAAFASESPKPDETPEIGATPSPTPAADSSSKPSPSPGVSESGEMPPSTPVPGDESKGESPEDEGDEEYDELVSRISNLLKEYGYDEQITVEKIGDFIYLRFREGVLFLPDQAVMKDGAAPVLTNISAVIMDSYDLISDIDISGHTARIPDDLPTKENLFSWELSTNRALTVLEYLVKQCDMPQGKLSVTGYSCNQLLVRGDTEKEWAQNRRVEIRLTKAERSAEVQESAQETPSDVAEMTQRPTWTPKPHVDRYNETALRFYPEHNLEPNADRLRAGNDLGSGGNPLVHKARSQMTAGFVYGKRNPLRIFRLRVFDTNPKHSYVVAAAFSLKVGFPPGNQVAARKDPT